jgi:hypothetical protein
MLRSVLAGLMALLVASAAGVAAPSLDLTLKPVVTDGLVSAIAVTVRYDLAKDSLKPLILPEKIGPLFHIAERIEALSATDAAGPLSFTASSGTTDKDQATPLGNDVHVWTPNRSTKGVVTVTYVARVSTEMLPGPSWEVRSEPRGVSAAGITFLLLPDDKTEYTTKLHWDLAALPQASEALTSLPPKVERLTAERLRNSYYMAGVLQSSPVDGGPFRAVSTAQSPLYDQKALLDFSAKAYGGMMGLFGPPKEPQFTVMFRGSQISDISGTELPGGLIATMKPTTPLAAVEGLAAHEMVHVFMNGLDPESWFEEGIAVMYQSRAPYLSGLFDPAQYIDDINKTARTYYSNVRYDMPMEEATKAFWTDARARLQSYVRGGLYFYQLDAKLKAKTNGKRGLDEVLREMIANRNAGRAVTVKDFLTAVSRDLGSQAEADYLAMMTGKRIIVPENAFGRCFRRKTEQMPIFELGFAMKSLMQQPRVIAELDPASPAAKAGLREGDKVLSATPLDGAQEDPDREMRVTVERDGKSLEIRFKPKGTKTLEGYQWERIPSVPDSVCRL